MFRCSGAGCVHLRLKCLCSDSQILAASFLKRTLPDPLCCFRSLQQQFCWLAAICWQSLEQCAPSPQNKVARKDCQKQDPQATAQMYWFSRAGGFSGRVSVSLWWSFWAHICQHTTGWAETQTAPTYSRLPARAWNTLKPKTAVCQCPIWHQHPPCRLSCAKSPVPNCLSTSAVNSRRQFRSCTWDECHTNERQLCDSNRNTRNARSLRSNFCVLEGDMTANER